MTATNAARRPGVLHRASRAGVTFAVLALSLLLTTPAHAAAPQPGSQQPPGTEGFLQIMGCPSADQLL